MPDVRLANTQSGITTKELAEEAIDLVNNSFFRIAEPGPLHAPVRCFIVRRDKRRHLLLETEAISSAASDAVKPAIGRIYNNTEQVKLKGPGGIEAAFDGVWMSSIDIKYADGDRGSLREKNFIHRLTVTIGDVAQGAFVIDWIENLANGPFLWPESYSTGSRMTVTRTFGRNDAQVVRTNQEETRRLANSAAQFTVGGRTIYLCSLDRSSSEGTLHPGCVVYTGVPDEAFRVKVRTAISFALGLYLVDLGHTLYDASWQVIEAEARSAYSLNMRAFELDAMPLVPVSAPIENARLMNPEVLDRAVNAFFAAYDDLDLSNMNWAYWHARTASIHIAPVHFGALIEALQRRYMRLGKLGGIIDTVAPEADWKVIEKSLVNMIGEGGITEDQRRALTVKVKSLTRS